jgi:hypothetical protein
MSESALNNLIVTCTQTAGLQVNADKLFAGGASSVNIEELYRWAYGTQRPRREEEGMGRHSLQMSMADQLWQMVAPLPAAARLQQARVQRRLDIGGAALRSASALPLVEGRQHMPAPGGRSLTLKMPVIGGR